MAEKNSSGNGRILTVVALVVGLVIGSMGTWISAGERFVGRQRYERDQGRLEKKVDQLLQFHLEDKRNGG